MRRLLRDIAAGKETVGDTTTLEDYSVLAKLRDGRRIAGRMTSMARLLLLIQVSRPIVWPVLPLVYALGHARRRMPS